METFDQWLLLFIQEQLRNDSLTSLVVFVTKLGNDGKIWLALIAMLLLKKSTRRLGVAAGLSFLLCVGAGEVLKHTVMRPRPFLEIQDLLPLVKKPHSFSFPSVHTVSSFAVAWIVLWRGRGWWKYAVFLFAVLMAFSRLYVGVHYPTDVLGGFLLGTGGSYLVHKKLGKDY